MTTRRHIFDIFIIIALLALISNFYKIFVTCYNIGVGRADCTGPPVEIAFMGYANLNQKGQGIHLRQYSRSFVVEDDKGKRAVFVSVDAGMMSHAIKRQVIKRLQGRYGQIYTMDNVVLSGTHTHATPGGFLMHLLYDISILGFVPQTFNALADGIFISIKRAHENVQPGKIYLDQTKVLNANVNRSPTSYMKNPSEERSQYESNVDKKLTQLRFISMDGNVLGVFNWFAVHPTSMNNTNRLVSSDNLGYASLLIEKAYNPTKLVGKGKFVGAFASSNLGDVSPNTMGPKCEFSGNSCDILTSACPKHEGQCVAQGPGKDMFESTRIIATRISDRAMTLIRNNAGREVVGDVSYIHQFVDMPSYNTTALNPLTGIVEKIQGCIPAMGYSFAAGTTDGPGVFLFQQGTTTDNALWNALRDFIVPPAEDDIKCHAPKPILLATGRATFPYEWQPKIVSTQLLQIGNIVIAAIPGELTTMAGRRLTSQIQLAALHTANVEINVIIAGLSNMYSSYITTPEEYQLQRYEAASTIYGPQTLTLYIDQYRKLTSKLLQNEAADSGPLPPYMDDRMLSLNTAVLFDGHPIGRDFGSVKIEPNKDYKLGETVRVSFVAGNPRNSLFHEKTYFTVERRINAERWKTVLTDANWETVMHWERVSTILGFSDINIIWTIEPSTLPGNYRIRHFGNYKYILGGIFPYEGISRTFSVST